MNLTNYNKPNGDQIIITGTLEMQKLMHLLHDQHFGPTQYLNCNMFREVIPPVAFISVGEKKALVELKKAIYNDFNTPAYKN